MDALTQARLDLVRKYKANPKLWPDGLDWPHWKKPHELWFTGREQYWYDLIDREDGKTVTPPPEAVTKPPVTKPPVVTKPSVTKPPVTKPNVTKPEGGRPPVGEQAMSDAERMRRYREQRKNAARAAMAMLGAPDVNAKNKKK